MATPSAASSTSPNNETVTLHLPTGEDVDAIVPSGLSDDQVRSYARMKRPDLFGAPAGVPSPGGQEGAARIGMHKSLIVGPSSVAPLELPEAVKQIGRGVLSASAPVIGHRVLQQMGVIKPGNLYRGETSLKGLPAAAATTFFTSDLAPELGEAPAVFPGAHLPEAPGPEIGQARALEQGARTAEEPSAALGRIHRPAIYPGAPEPTATPEQLNPSLVLASAEKPAVIARPDTSPKRIGELLNEATGGQGIQRGVSMRNQPATQARPPLARVPAGEEIPIGRTAQAIEESLPASKAPKLAPTEDVMGAIRASQLPQDFTPTPKSAWGLGYKYDPAARTFEYITNSGQRYTRADVDPEAFEQFERTAREKDSFGKAFKNLQDNPRGGVAQLKNGRPVKPITRGEIPEGEEVPPGGVLRAIEESVGPKKSVIAKPAATKPGASLKIGGKDVEPDTDLASALKKSIPAGKRPSPKTNKTGTQ